MAREEIEKTNSEVLKFIASIVGFVLVLVVFSYILALLLRPDTISSAEGIVTVIIPSGISGLVGMAVGSKFGEKDK